MVYDYKGFVVRQVPYFLFAVAPMIRLITSIMTGIWLQNVKSNNFVSNKLVSNKVITYFCTRKLEKVY